MRHLRQRIAGICVAVALLLGCARSEADPTAHGSAALRLKPVAAPITGSVTRRQVYVPVYSSIYWGIRPEPVELSSTVSIRNVSSRHPLVLESVRYFDSAGKQMREYLNTPSELGALASVEFVIQQSAKAGGPGANFLVRWAGSTDMDEPLIEAIMVGQHGNAGISFTSPGRVLKDEAQ